MKKQNKQSTDFIFGSIIFVLGVIAYYLTYKIRDVSGSGTISAATVPRFCAAVLMLLGIILVVTVLARKFKTRTPRGYEVSEQETTHTITPIFFVLADFILYAALVPLAGFLIVTPPFAFVLMFLLAPADNRKPLQFLIIAIITAIIIYVLFVYGFRVMLPAGLIKI
jgi:putative tricarboxylic transport membrane protein